MPSLAEDIAAAKKALEKRKTFLAAVADLSALLPRCRAAPGGSDADGAAPRAALLDALRRAQQVYTSRHDDPELWTAADALLAAAAADAGALGLADAEQAALGGWREQLEKARPTASSAPPPPAGDGAGAAAFDWGSGVRPPQSAGSAQIAEQRVQQMMQLLTGGEWGSGGADAVPQHILDEIERQEQLSAPRASREAKDNLLLVTVPADTSGGEWMCCVCQEDFAPRSKAKKMPCGHLFHDECLLDWLAKSTTCPLCRLALPKEELDCPKKLRQDAERVAGRDPTKSSQLYC